MIIEKVEKMKRSEAVKKLTEIHNRLFTTEMMEQFTDEELCAKLLERIETELKMVPQTFDQRGYPIRKWELEE